MSRRRSRYPSEYRQPILELVRSGRSPYHLASEFEPSAQSIRNWVAQADRDEGRRSDGRRQRSVRSCAGCGWRYVGCARSGRSWQSHGLVLLGDGPEGVLRLMRADQTEFRIATMARVARRLHERLLRPVEAAAVDERVVGQRSRGAGAVDPRA